MDYVGAFGFGFCGVTSACVFLGLVGACVLGYGLGLDCRIWACCGVGAIQVSCAFVSHGLDLGFVVCVCMWICSLAGIFVLGEWS